MIPAIVIVLSIAVAGLPLAMLTYPRAGAYALAGTAYLLGSGWIALVMLAFSLAGFRWAPLPVVAFALAPLVAILPFAFRRRIAAVRGPGAPPSLVVRLIDVFTCAVLFGYSIFATLAPIGEWDFWAIWGLKARTFFDAGGIDWSFLARPDNSFIHGDYPVLVPLLLDFFSLLRGAWDDRWIGLLFTAFGAAVLLIAREELDEEARTRLLSSIATLAMTGLALTLLVGMAEGALIAFAGASIILIRKGLTHDDADLVRTGALFAGLAAFTKNEGLTFVVAIVVAAVIQLGRNWRPLVHLWPAAVVPLPWIVAKKLHHLTSYFESGSTAERILQRISHPGEITRALVTNAPNHPLFWLSALAIIVVCFPRIVRRERFGFAAVTIQCAFYIAAYAATPFEVGWHIATSWSRLLDQLAVPLMFLCIVAILPMIGMDRESTARSQ